MRRKILCNRNELKRLEGGRVYVGMKRCVCVCAVCGEREV